MDTIQIKDKTFRPYIRREEIKAAIEKIAARINNELAGENPLFICVLNGAFVFAADLLREITIESEITFMRMKSYSGTQSTGVVKIIHGLDEDIKDRTVIVVEDIIDTGFTMQRIINQLKEREPKQVKIATLLFKPKALKCDVHVDYAALEIPNDFIVGYGLDYDEQGRNLKDIYVIAD
ncbi:hypoxanthine phosphoribosyltransferase [Coprobacter fastidiosus]|jgi:hypoxanthine phosphoribosyltransferase|nr:hypoxanthine phosphoribosyltransferase [Coprobacter fastidiosus]MBS6411396.1 hypoxanthine phosphoribosyltransferase [Tannerella sp.]RHO60230.1 hypoxanthine phosphoribosyltransferase [Tannerella sp. AM09-19]RHS46122.1 hypoxanthine phosphoribosyltransferase [Tannerella sp. AF04-6]ERM89230.1 hypoxanthine phosphoribosyltransferase [Coprobacter fastidiosus NSB1 = JCM 33896]PWM09718.1 MAG: hypoxanthine phosphoribosyltransferase [Coprobacter fastidiosus]